MVSLLNDGKMEKPFGRKCGGLVEENLCRQALKKQRLQSGYG
ncbi:hypothetical protein KLPP_21770 [Klebsiella pneumoniae subsp. pneumoniae]|nr:hypothetical protein KLPP_21770 [Klebsiella pneumoniae subsp. pneumoniae]SAW49497.1 Uncharacterised protein [Klebsiella pneumoniae]SWE69096.1 Uncharacterised protein [Klebsiella pneumoniae]SWT54568.1 Uncharacterised protein [Klebsiella pneumoniae]SXH63758.1 Uncharacterised protein [Klebsiella pneumoniae]